MVKQWDIVTIGHLSRNRYWGESETKPYRPALCTCTLVSGDGFRLLVDPSVADGEQMAFELFRRTGSQPKEITHVFITHAHGDHHAGLRHFAQASWLAADGVAAAINASAKYSRRVEPVADRLLDALDVVRAPGHTADHHGLRFDCDGLSIVIAGDAVMTRDFWRDGAGFFNSVDPELAARTIERLTEIADIIVPGHDNYILTQRRSTT
jgi:glyoxylase-like metal-dependent hydrolase (beta-lactamase superfamily II)